MGEWKPSWRDLSSQKFRTNFKTSCEHQKSSSSHCKTSSRICQIHSYIKNNGNNLFPCCCICMLHDSVTNRGENGLTPPVISTSVLSLWLSFSKSKQRRYWASYISYKHRKNTNKSLSLTQSQRRPFKKLQLTISERAKSCIDATRSVGLER